MKSITNTLVLIPEGHIELRDDRLKKKWRVDIARFQLAKHLVTQAQYIELIKSNPSTFKGNENPVETLSWLDAIHFCNVLSVKENLTPYYSIDTVTNDIKQVVNSKGYRLPTEAEWEYACRAGTTTAYFFGNDETQLDKYAWYDKNSDEKFHKVGQKLPNPWGLYDMLGNVMEWTLDHYDADRYTSINANDPVALPNPLRYPKTLRGGGFTESAGELRSAKRFHSDPSWNKRDPQIPKSKWWLTEAGFVGFRLVRPMQQPSKESVDLFFKNYLGL